MDLIPRPFQHERDLEAMRELLVAGRRANNGSYYIHVGDINWWMYYPPFAGDYWNSLYLWGDPGRAGSLLGWALLSQPGTFDVYLRPHLRGTQLADGMYTWAVEKATASAREAAEKRVRVQWVAADDSVLDGWLRGHGFTRYNEDVLLACDLSAPIPQDTLPEGMIVRSCRGLDEVEARAAAQHGAFGSTAPFERYLARFEHFMQSPVYEAERDVVAVAADGKIGAFCIIWIDCINRVGLFEPVGTHPHFQRKGLGKTVMREALRHLKGHGMQQAIVCTAENNLPAIRLYESVGFCVVNRLGYYERDIEE